MNLLERIDKTVDFLRSKIDGEVDIAVVLGTGLGGFANEVSVEIEIPYKEIPNFPVSTVEGHAGSLVVGTLEGVRIIAMKGRFHFYEGYSMEEVVFPIRVFKRFGIHRLLLSNASGGVNPDFRVGDMMVINDHINLFPSNPLIGPNLDELGPRFPDMSEPYDRSFISLINSEASKLGTSIHQGVYAGVSGPCFETPAEYKYLRIIGADAVGMSTVPECIAARHMGMQVAALSVITDLGIEGQVESVSHEEVQAAAAKAEPKVAAVVRSFLRSLPR